MKGIVTNIQRFSIHDGPGIRTTVFLKGCNLRCFWCHNPESYRGHPELCFYSGKCIGCGKCFAACPLGCHTVDSLGAHRIDRERCVRCGACAGVCNAGALQMTGREYTVDEVMRTVLADAPFYRNSGGGMTCSGGEPLLQSGFVADLMRSAKKAGIHTALDTAGNVDYTAFERVLPHTDLILYDLKCMDDGRHEQLTGASNRRILENLRRLGKGQTPVWIRIPVIPGANDSEENMRAVAEFLYPLGAIRRVALLPYHSLGIGKYEGLGIEGNGVAALKPPSAEALAALARLLEGGTYEIVSDGA